MRGKRRTFAPICTGGMSVADLRPSVVDLSDRPMLCMAVNGQAGRAARACVGSTDHGLWVVDVGQARKDRELYTKTAGHAEWVTACAYMDERRRRSRTATSKSPGIAASSPAVKILRSTLVRQMADVRDMASARPFRMCIFRTLRCFAMCWAAWASLSPQPR